MKKSSVKIIIFSIVFILLINLKIYAAGSFSLSASKTSINQGESTTITITRK